MNDFQNNLIPNFSQMILGIRTSLLGFARFFEKKGDPRPSDSHSLNEELRY